MMPPMSSLLRALTLVLVILGIALAPAVADAKGKKKAKAAKKYHFELLSVRVQEGVEGKAAADALRLLEAELVKQFGSHPQLVADMSKAPDPEKDPKGYTKWLTKKKIAGAFKVNVDVSMYTEEIEDSPTGDGGTGAKRLVVRLSLHMFGETIPKRMMGFEGQGSSTVKQDVGKKVRDKDREFTIQSAVELAVADALKTSLAELAKPAAKPSKK